MGICLRCTVSGRVQGVFFRAAAQQEARGLGVTGYARNLPDGRVEVLACGEEYAIDRFRDWLWEGPTAAHVDNVDCALVEDAPPEDFSAR